MSNYKIIRAHRICERYINDGRSALTKLAGRLRVFDRWGSNPALIYQDMSDSFDAIFTAFKIAEAEASNEADKAAAKEEWDAYCDDVSNWHSVGDEYDD